LEYNFRPYSRFQMIGLLNLHDFARGASHTGATALALW
jgi:hypothetical protein